MLKPTSTKSRAVDEVITSSMHAKGTTTRATSLPLRLSISQCCEIANVGRTHLYKIIAKGQLRAKKDGRRTYVLVDDLLAWVENLPDFDRVDIP